MVANSAMPTMAKDAVACFLFTISQNAAYFKRLTVDDQYYNGF
jgi:hypothetical protein